MFSLGTIAQVIKQRPTFVGLLVLVLLVFLAPANFIDFIIFHRDKIDQGQWWRLLTGHLIHLNWQHLFLNSFGLLVSLWVCPKWMGRWPFIPFFLFVCLVDGLGLYWFDLDLWQYTGISGVLYGVLLVAIFFSPFYKPVIRWLASGLVVVKVLWEQTPWYTDTNVSDFINAQVAHNAHFYGLIAGFVTILGVVLLSRLNFKPGHH